MSTRIAYLCMAMVIILSLVAGCAQPTPQVVEKVVKETVVVEKVVKETVPVKETVVVRQTQVVEKIVERTVVVPATPADATIGGTYIVGRGGDSVILDLAAATDGESWRVGQEVLDKLVAMEGTSTKIIPWLAESWETKDTKTWTFNIRKGVKFHDGTDCDCAAVKFNIDRWRDEKNPYRYNRTFEYFNYQFGKDFFTEVECVDSHKLKLVLGKPTMLVLAKLALGSFGISSPKAIMDQKEKYGTAAGTVVGTGPFMFVEWVPADRITLKRNPDWWGGPPRFDRIIFRSIPDNTARFAELKAGKLHQADLAQTDLPAAQKDPNLQVHKLPPLSTGYIAFQQTIKPFDNVKVRWAIAHAINREALIKPFYGDWGTLATCFQPPTILGHNPNLKPIPYDVNKAKQLLTEAGYPNGFTTDFWYIPVIRGYFPDAKAIAEAIAIDLAKVNIKVNLKTQDWGAYLADRNEGKFPMWMLGWGSDNGDPDNYIGWHFSHPVGQPKKEDGYNSPKLAQLLIDGAIEPDQAKREKIYMEAEQIVYDDMARLPVVWASGSMVLRNEVKGYVPVVFRSWYEKMWLGK